MSRVALLLVAGLTAMALLGCEERVLLSGSWCDPAWGARVPIAFRYTDRDANLTDFPVLITLDATRIDYALTAPEGRDLRVVDRASCAVLPHEIDTWNPGGTSYLWVRVPMIPAGVDDPVIDVYFANQDAPEIDDAPAVFSNDYLGVYHLNDDLWDASPSRADGSNRGSTAAAGRIGAGRHFVRDDGTYVGLAGNAALPIGEEPRTLEAWLNPDNIDNGAHYMVASWGGESPFSIHRYSDGLFCGWGPDEPIVANAEEYALEVGRFYHAVCTYDGVTAQLYIDGVLATEDVRDFRVDGTTAFIGADSEIDDGERWDGILDEVRFSRGVRSPVWIDANYRSMTDTLLDYRPFEGL